MGGGAHMQWVATCTLLYRIILLWSLFVLSVQFNINATHRFYSSCKLHLVWHAVRTLSAGVCKQWTGLLEWITGLDYWTDL